jgi:dihydroorotate dehydrogenase
MGVYESLIRPLAFRCDPEWVHEHALDLIARDWVRTQPFADRRLSQTLMGLDFSNPIGLAAGFDKNGVALAHWAKLGFGFVEAGTVTAHAQPGNERPRLFRLAEDRAIVNRMGFNNDGAAALAARLERTVTGIPLGINLGKSKVTELEKAAEDYAASFRLLHQRGAYFVVNVSSPNTPGLRTLQDRGPLLAILAALRAIDPAARLFVKIAPDLEEHALAEIADLALEAGLTGLIATNTTLDRSGLNAPCDQAGGLSGAPLRARANAVLAFLARRLPPEVVLIGVGGIMNATDVLDKVRLGAHLVQVYTGWVYGGPGWVPQTLREIVATLEQDQKTLAGLHRSAL